MITCSNSLYLGLLWLRLRWGSKKSEDLISAVRPITLSRGRERRKHFEIDTPESSCIRQKVFFVKKMKKGRLLKRTADKEKTSVKGFFPIKVENFV